jgi:hypothetical protein
MLQVEATGINQPNSSQNDNCDIIMVIMADDDNDDDNNNNNNTNNTVNVRT